MSSEPSKVVRSAPPNAGKGRKKGTPNKTTGALKDAILLAAERAGADGEGQDGLTGYLTMVAKSDIKAFSGLLGKVLPMTIAGDDDGGLVVQIIKLSRADDPAPSK